MNNLLKEPQQNDNIIHNKKTFLIILLIVLLFISSALTVVGVAMSSVEDKVVGVWASSRYLDRYDVKTISDDVYSFIEFKQDGTYYEAEATANLGIFKIKIGTWKTSGFDINVEKKGEIGTYIYSYNPFTDEIDSSYWFSRGDWVYQRSV